MATEPDMPNGDDAPEGQADRQAEDEVLVAAPAAGGAAPQAEGAGRGPRGGGGGRGPRGGGPRGGGPREGGSREGGSRGPRPGGNRNAPRVSLEPLTRLVAHLAKALVDRPDEVAVREVQGDRFPRIELSVAQDDIGKVIGKDGRTAQCMRALLQAAAARTGARAHLDIVD